MKGRYIREGNKVREIEMKDKNGFVQQRGIRTEAIRVNIDNWMERKGLKKGI